MPTLGLALFDPSSTFSYIAIYFTSRLGVNPNPSLSWIHVSTLMGDSLMID